MINKHFIVKFLCPECNIEYPHYEFNESAEICFRCTFLLWLEDPEVTEKFEWY